MIAAELRPGAVASLLEKKLKDGPDLNAALFVRGVNGLRLGKIERAESSEEGGTSPFFSGSSGSSWGPTTWGNGEQDHRDTITVARSGSSSWTGDEDTWGQAPPSRVQQGPFRQRGERAAEGARAEAEQSSSSFAEQKQWSGAPWNNEDPRADAEAWGAWDASWGTPHQTLPAAERQLLDIPLTSEASWQTPTSFLETTDTNNVQGAVGGGGTGGATAGAGASAAPPGGAAQGHNAGGSGVNPAVVGTPGAAQTPYNPGAAANFYTGEGGGGGGEGEGGGGGYGGGAGVGGPPAGKGKGGGAPPQLFAGGDGGGDGDGLAAAASGWGDGGGAGGGGWGDGAGQLGGGGGWGDGAGQLGATAAAAVGEGDGGAPTPVSVT